MIPAEEAQQHTTLLKCKTCGASIEPSADFCPRCGARQADAVLVAMGNARQMKYCPNCGRLIDDAAEICPACGVRVPSTHHSAVPTAKYNRITAALFAIFLGGFGVHCFYLQEPGKGVGLLAMTLIGLILSLAGIGFLLLIPVSIICIVDFIRYLSMSDEAWAAKYPA